MKKAINNRVNKKEKRLIRVLIVEDSIVAREFLRHILDSDPEIEVIGAAKHGAEALEFLAHSKPDLVTMDINMPDMDGFETTRRIMAKDPLPIVIVTASWNPYSQETVFRALEAGALTVLQKPKGIGHPHHEKDVRELIKMVKLMSEIKVVKRHTRYRKAPVDSVSPGVTEKEMHKIEIVAIGASTGGPAAVRQILEGIDSDGKNPPIVIVQHIAEGFLQGLVDWLAATTKKAVYIAADGEQLRPGGVYFAPDHFDMGVTGTGRIRLYRGTGTLHICPSVSHLFGSVAKVYGSRAAGIILTGMGVDGAAELKMMRNKGALTVAQSRESAVVYGMPGEAERIGAAEYLLDPEGIALVINQLKTG